MDIVFLGYCIFILGIFLIITGKNRKDTDGKISRKGKAFLKTGIILIIAIVCLEAFLMVTYTQKPGLPFQKAAKPLNVQKVTDEYFTHQSGIFRIKPPKGFGLLTQTEKTVDFMGFDQNTKSSLFIKIVDESNGDHQGYTDEQALEQFKDETFKQGWINTFAERSGLKVLADRFRYVNNIPAWEYGVYELFDQGALKGKGFVFYKNKKQFNIMFFTLEKYFNEQEKDIEDALKTFEILQ